MLEVRSDSIRLTAIEKIRAGDKVISTNADTFETEEKTVLETYIRWTDKLIHLVINGEELITTETHPFYVKERGFVNAGKLLIGDPLLDVHGNILVVENTRIEYLDEPETVYNFQVEDFHTYYVGTNCIFVHNANYGSEVPKRPSWRKSEIDAKNSYPDYEFQKSFKNGSEVTYGTKGSTRPELYKPGHSIEVKNYKVQTSAGQNSLINNVSKQIHRRTPNLPSGTKQTVIIDVRGQTISNEILKSIRSRILGKINVEVEIIFKR